METILTTTQCLIISSMGRSRLSANGIFSLVNVNGTPLNKTSIYTLLSRMVDRQILTDRKEIITKLNDGNKVEVYSRTYKVTRYGLELLDVSLRARQGLIKAERLKAKGDET